MKSVDAVFALMTLVIGAVVVLAVFVVIFSMTTKYRK